MRRSLLTIRQFPALAAGVHTVPEGHEWGQEALLHGQVPPDLQVHVALVVGRQPLRRQQRTARAVRVAEIKETYIISERTTSLP